MNSLSRSMAHSIIEMKVFVWTITLLGAFLHCFAAMGGNCGCAPGLEGNIGFKGNRGAKGEFGIKGAPGFQGYQGVIGDKGLNGLPGAKGDKGLKGPAPGVQMTYGPSGEAGPQGRCLCKVIRRYAQPVVVGDYYLTDENGEPTFIGDIFNEQAFEQTIYRPKPRPPPPPPPSYNRPNYGLFMMSSSGVLMPVNDAKAFDLFAGANPYASAETTTTTTTTTTTEPPTSRYTDEHHHPPPNIIYVLGPRGSLIPIDAVGAAKHFKPGFGFGSGYAPSYVHKPYPSSPPPIDHYQPPGHYPSPGYNSPPSHYFIKPPGKLHGHGYYPPPPGPGHHSYPGQNYVPPPGKGSSSYFKWFRNIMMGENDDPEDQYDTDVFNAERSINKAPPIEDDYEAPEAVEPFEQSYESEKPRGNTDESEV